MARQLTVHTAEITTAAVEITTLTIRGKQVTLAVFRQLQRRELIATDGTLNGVPWGTVNYHPYKRCDVSSRHWHVVWQDGDELCQDAVNQAIDFYSLRTEAADRFISACVAREAAGLAHGYFGGQIGVVKDHHMSFHTDSIPTISIHAELVPVVADAYDAVRRMERHHEEWKNAEENSRMHPDSEWCAKNVPKVKERYDTAEAKVATAYSEPRYAEYLSAGSPDHWHEVLRAEVEAERDRRQRHRDVRTALGDLPQLFIAV